MVTSVGRILPERPEAWNARPFLWSNEYRARSIGVSDGDMITVLTAEKKQDKTRLARIDTSEPGQDIGWRPKQASLALAAWRGRVRDGARERETEQLLLPPGELP